MFNICKEKGPKLTKSNIILIEKLTMGTNVNALQKIGQLKLIWVSIVEYKYIFF